MMNIQITGHGITITAAMRQQIEDKFSGLQDHFQGINSVKIIVKKPENHFSYRVTSEVHATKATLFAQATNEDFYKALEVLRHKITRQIDKHHDILMQRHHHPKDDPHVELHHDEEEDQE